jgi:hypothetical protein
VSDVDVEELGDSWREEQGFLGDPEPGVGGFGLDVCEAEVLMRSNGRP